MIKFSILEQLEMIGIGSLVELLGIAVIALLMVLALLATMIKVRGQNFALFGICSRDVLIACGWALTFFGVPMACYFMGRAFWRAATWGELREQSA